MQSASDVKTKADKKLEDRHHQIARLAALTLIFSYAELLIPRLIPFFRLGLGNTALLLGLGNSVNYETSENQSNSERAADSLKSVVPPLSFPAFMLLSLLKTLASNLMAGTLFSPFFLVSLAQTLVSALTMFILSRGQHLLSIYGISATASALSAVVQIFLSSLYLGQGTWSLLGPMLIFNLVSGIITAALAEFLTGGGSLPLRSHFVARYPLSGGHPRNAPGENSGLPPAHRTRNILGLALLFAAAASVFFIKNTAILCGILLLSFLAQRICGRKILLLPHLWLWLFVLFTSLLLPNGRVLYSFAGFSITAGAFHNGLQKALRLSAVSALSQCAVSFKPKENTLLSLTLEYYKLMNDSFKNTSGSIITRLKAALSIQ